jgi:hypothetical protein
LIVSLNDPYRLCIVSKSGPTGYLIAIGENLLGIFWSVSETCSSPSTVNPNLSPTLHEFQANAIEIPLTLSFASTFIKECPIVHIFTEIYASQKSLHIGSPDIISAVFLCHCISN